MLRLAYEPWMQDWPVEVADGSRIEEFLDHYDNEQRPEHKRVIVEVLLVSLDDSFSRARPSGAILERLANVLKRHPALLDYWLRPDAASEDEMFAITPWLRTI